MRSRSLLLFAVCVVAAAVSTACVEGESEMQGCEVDEEADDGVTRILCPDGTSAEVPHGEDGEDGTSCSVEDNGDGTSTLSCEDGTEVTVEDGEDGEDGTDCSVEDNGDGTATISCGDDTEVVIEDGEDGQSCSVEEHGDGTATITCGDDSATVGCTATDNGDGTTTLSCGNSDVTIEDGDDCTATDNGDGTYDLTCGDETVTVEDGEDAEACTVSDNGDGTATLSCPDGTETDVPVSLPELTVTDFSVEADRNDVIWNATVANAGNEETGPFWIDFHLDKSQAPDPESNVFGDEQQKHVDSLIPGEETQMSGRLEYVADGSYDSWFVADPLGDVSESDLDDNVSGPETVQVDYSGPDAQLEVTNFDVQENSGEVQWNATIQNNGSETSESFRVDFHFDEDSAPTAGDTGYDHTTVTAVDPGSSVNVSGTLDSGYYDGDTFSNTYDCWVNADTYERNADTDRSDNVDGPVQVTAVNPNPNPEADLAIENLEAYGGQEQVTFVLEYTNNGPEDSVYFFFDVFFDGISNSSDEFFLGHPTETGETRRMFKTFSLDDSYVGDNTGLIEIFTNTNDDPDTDNNLADDDYSVTAGQ